MSNLSALKAIAMTAAATLAIVATNAAGAQARDIPAGDNLASTQLQSTQAPNYSMQEDANVGPLLLGLTLISFAALAKLVLSDTFYPTENRVPVGGGDLDNHPYNHPDVKSGDAARGLEAQNSLQMALLNAQSSVYAPQ